MPNADFHDRLRNIKYLKHCLAPAISMSSTDSPPPVAVPTGATVAASTATNVDIDGLADSDVDEEVRDAKRGRSEKNP